VKFKPLNLLVLKNDIDVRAPRFGRRVKQYNNKNYRTQLSNSTNKKQNKTSRYTYLCGIVPVINENDLKRYWDSSFGFLAWSAGPGELLRLLKKQYEYVLTTVLTRTSIRVYTYTTNKHTT